MWQAIKRWWAAEGALVGLQGLDDRLLADMGLERTRLRKQVMGQVDPTSPWDDCHHRHPARALTAPD